MYGGSSAGMHTHWRWRCASHVESGGGVQHEGGDAVLRWALQHVFAVITAQRRAAGVLLSDVEKVFVRPAGGEAAVLAHEDLGAPLAVCVLLPDAVDLPQVRLQRAALREGFLTQITAVRTDTCAQRERLERLKTCRRPAYCLWESGLVQFFFYVKNH